MDDFASTLEREACEARSLLNRLADMLAQESAKDLQRHGLQEQNVSQDIEDKQSNIVKSQNLLHQFSLTSGLNFRNVKVFSYEHLFRYSTGICARSRTAFIVSNML